VASVNRRTGWVIIAVDILIVLVVYFAYTQLRDVENHTERRQNGITYRLTVKKAADKNIPTEFLLESRRRSPLTVEFPKGVTLLVSDGRRNVYRRESIDIARSIKIEAGESRSWSQTLPLPDQESSSLYVGFFIDEQRQGQVKVPQ